MLKLPRRSGLEPAELAWPKVVRLAHNLRTALEAPGSAGGACRAASSGRWSPEAHDAAIPSGLARRGEEEGDGG